MSDNMFCEPGDEYMEDDPEEIGVRAWEDDRDSPITVEEWTMRPLCEFIHAAHTIDHVIERQCEEYGDENGDVYDKLIERSTDPEVVAAFDAALDLLFKDIRWSWAHKHVATWRVSWDDSDDPDHEGSAPDFKLEKIS